MATTLTSVSSAVGAPGGAPAADGRVPEPPPASHPGPDPSGAPSPRSVLEALGLVTAPATLLGALALYFGAVYTNAQAFYFGIDAAMLGLSGQEYVLRSVDALFVPVGALVLGGLALLGAHRVLDRSLGAGQRPRLLSAVTWTMGSVGALMFGVAVVAVFRPLPLRTPFLFAPLSEVSGIVMLGYAFRLHSRPARGQHRSWVSRANALLVGVLVIVGLFWGCTDYARALGRGRAQLLHAGLSARPGVVVYSVQRLHLEGDGVEETALVEEGANEFRFRYAGLRLFTRAGGRLFLLPAQWSVADGRALIVPDDEHVRVEFTVGSSS
jgi:hypothetical protein